jgi:hypothetical protein
MQVMNVPWASIREQRRTVDDILDDQDLDVDFILASFGLNLLRWRDVYDLRMMGSNSKAETKRGRQSREQGLGRRLSLGVVLPQSCSRGII